MDGIRVKGGVRFDPRTVGRSEFWRMSEAVQAVAPPDYYATITSGCDGRHKTDSKHYLGWAKDYRVRDFPGVVFIKKTRVGDSKGKKFWECTEGLNVLLSWVARIQKRLGNLYFVDLEIKKVHIHIQYNGGQLWGSDQTRNT